MKTKVLKLDNTASGEVELNDDIFGLEPRAELRRRPTHALADGTHPTVPAGEHGDDPVGLAELVHPEDDRLIPIQRHPSMVPPSADSERLRRGRCRP